MTENEAKERALAIYEQEEWFILLSVNLANMKQGKSIPYMGKMPNGEKILLVFSTYEGAKEFVDKTGYEVLDGVYPIGRLEKSHEYSNLQTVFSVALQMGVGHVNFDPHSKDAFGCSIMWFMNVNELDPDALPDFEDEDESENAKEQDGKVALRVVPVDIYQYSNPYQLTPERGEEVTYHVFELNPSDRLYMFKAFFLTKQSLHENVFLSEILNTRLIPRAKESGREGDIQWFVYIIRFLQIVIWDRLFDGPVYTLVDEKGALCKKDKGMYVLYTDLFKYMGKLNYKRISSQKELVKLAKDNGVEVLIVTDGPDEMAIIPKEIWDPENSKQKSPS